MYRRISDLYQSFRRVLSFPTVPCVFRRYRVFSNGTVCFPTVPCIFRRYRVFSDGTVFRQYRVFSDGTVYFRRYRVFPPGTVFFRRLPLPSDRYPLRDGTAEVSGRRCVNLSVYPYRDPTVPWPRRGGQVINRKLISTVTREDFQRTPIRVN